MLSSWSGLDPICVGEHERILGYNSKSSYANITKSGTLLFRAIFFFPMWRLPSFHTHFARIKVVPLLPSCRNGEANVFYNGVATILNFLLQTSIFYIPFISLHINRMSFCVTQKHVKSGQIAKGWGPCSIWNLKFELANYDLFQSNLELKHH